MPTDTKIRAEHLRRQAVVSVRQATPHQVRGNRESTVRRYALVDRAKPLGRPAAAVQTIAEDTHPEAAHVEWLWGMLHRPINQEVIYR